MARIGSSLDISINVANTATSNIEKLGVKLSSGEKINSSEDNPVDFVKINHDLKSSSNLFSFDEELNRVASSIKAADSSMDAIAKQIDLMKSQLLDFKKMFPPYPPGSQERINFMRMFSGMRKMIDQLTIPPDENASKLLADPAIVTDAGDWKVLAGPDNKSITIKAHQVHSGPSGLNIPVLADNATDTDVDNALASLDAATKDLVNKRFALNGDAETVANAIESNKKKMLFLKESLKFNEFTTAEMTDISAEITSEKTKQDLSLEAIKSLTSVTTTIIELLS